MSFDPVIDQLGDNRSEYPLTCFLVAGTQNERPRDNELLVMKLSNLTGMKREFFFLVLSRSFWHQFIFLVVGNSKFVRMI